MQPGRKPPQGSLQHGAPPAGAIIADRQYREIIRRDNQPPVPHSKDQVKYAKKIHGGTKSGPMNNGRLVVPKTRNLTPDMLWEEECKIRPKKQKFCVAWYFGPTTPNKSVAHIHLIPLQFCASEPAARRCCVEVRRRFPKRTALVFQVGRWIALPPPFWIDTSNVEAWQAEAVAYNGRVIQGLMHHRQKSLLVEQEVLKRRSKQDPKDTDQSVSVRDMSKKLEDGVYGETPAGPLESDAFYGSMDDTGDDEDEEKSFPAPPPPPQPKSFSFTPDQPNEETEQMIINDAKPFLVRSQNWGLVWSLPSLQHSRDVTNVAAALHGAYRSEADAESAKTQIMLAHPEWSIELYRMGDPLRFPFPTWLMQNRGDIKYSQDEVSEFMHRGDREHAEFEQKQQNDEAAVERHKQYIQQQQASGSATAVNDIANLVSGPMSTSSSQPPPPEKTGPLISSGSNDYAYGKMTYECHGPTPGDTDSEMGDE